MSVSPARRMLLATSALALTGGLATVAPVVQAATPTTSTALGGGAYASTATFGTLVKSGKTADLPMCTIAPSYSGSNNVAAVKLGRVGSVGAATTTVRATTSGSTRTSTVTAKTAATNLLGGLVRASAITSTSVAWKDSSGSHLKGSSVIAGLRISGLPVVVSSKPNQVITLVGVGTVTLNAQTVHNRYGAHSITTTAMKVSLLAKNRLGLPSGTVVVSSANASVHDATVRRAYGTAFSTEFGVAGRAGSGRTAAVYLPCGGTSGSVITNHTARVDLPGVLKVGAMSSTGQSTESARSGIVATTRSQAAGVTLLGGVVRVDAVTAKATATRNPSKLVTSAAGTRVNGLKIRGKSVSVNVKENTRINIAGLGTLWLDRVVRSGSQIQVYGVQLHLTSAYSGHPAGTYLTIASARAGIA